VRYKWIGDQEGLVWIRVLGPIEVPATDGATLALGTPKQRAVCALLLVRADRLVSLDEVMDELWPERPPRSAVANARTYVARLRRLFATAAGGLRIEPRARGYVLHVEADHFDLPVFQNLVRRGREELDAGRVNDAADNFRRALALWRGTPFADVPVGPVLAARRATLLEQHAGAVEDLAEARFGLGQGKATIPALREHVRNHPLRERGWELLIRALQRSGDVAGALQAYATARARLVEELGIEPGEALQALHKLVLSGQRPAPDEVRAKPAAGGRPLPAQLPPDVAGFTGRHVYLDQLDALRPGEHPSTVVISAIKGTAGVGKTALAVHWGHRVADRFPDGQLYVNLRGFDISGSVMSAADAIRGFLEALGVPPEQIPADLPAQTALYRSVLAGKRVLVVLDNARDAEQVRPLLPGAPGCQVVVTSRNKLASLVAVEGARPVALDVLPADEARQLLSRRLGPDRIAAEPRAVKDLIARCAGLPLALAVVAARAATNPTSSLAALADDLRTAHDALDPLEGGDAATDIRALFACSYDALGEPAARLFRLLGLHCGPDISTAAAASMAGLPPSRVRPLLAQLTGAHLITEHTPGRFSSHDLLRAYANERAYADDSAVDRRAALRRVLDHYVHTAGAAAMLLKPHRDPITRGATQPGVTLERLSSGQEALAWFTAESQVLVAAITQAAREGFDVHAWQLAWAGSDYFDHRARWRDWKATHEIALDCARRLGDPWAQGYAHRTLARLAGEQRRYDDAHEHCRQAVDAYSAADDLAGLAQIHFVIGWVCDLQDRAEDSRHYVERALALAEQAGHRSVQAHALNALGWLDSQRGDNSAALERCVKALALQQEIGDRAGEAATLDSIGYIHHHLGRYPDAVDCFQRALEVYRELGDRYVETIVLRHLGDTYEAAGDTEAAGAARRYALAILDDIDHPDAAQVRARLHGQASPGEG
jgi:DNA-binding SARP family transcriptional activator